MGIPDRIILTLYTFLMAVVAVLVVLCSLGVIGQTAITAFFATIPGNWEKQTKKHNGKYVDAVQARMNNYRLAKLYLYPAINKICG